MWICMRRARIDANFEERRLIGIGDLYVESGTISLLPALAISWAAQE